MTNNASTSQATTSGRGRGRKGKRSASPATVADERIRQERAYQLRLGLMTFQEIADSPHPEDPSRTLYSCESAARRGYLAARDRHAGTQETEDMRQEWIARNEKVFRALYPRCLRGELLAIDRYTRLFSEHISMLGLRRLDVSGQVDVRVEGAWDASFRELSEQLAGLDPAEVREQLPAQP
ncbi:hypothetical protein [Pseudonocardia sp. NPDC049635]|uniref:hypothetical protein n=1 Tax=Pseudonocardia sp. NPDC049635 TaxID=3155506 RepID=UPI0033C11545